MSKKRVEVIIGGSVYSLQGNESEEHMQHVVKVINEKLVEIHAAYGKAYKDQNKISALLALNLADDYVKKQETLEAYTTSVEKTIIENEQLKERVKELTLQLAHIKEQLAIATHQGKREHTNRGR